MTGTTSDPSPPSSTFTASTAAPSTNASPIKAMPMHDPSRTAVVVKQKPLGQSNPNQVVPGQTVDHSIPGASMGQKALLAKKFATAQGSTISPTDALQSPCTAKLNGAKQRRFAKTKAAAFRLTDTTDENKS